MRLHRYLRLGIGSSLHRTIIVFPPQRPHSIALLITAWLGLAWLYRKGVRQRIQDLETQLANESTTIAPGLSFSRPQPPSFLSHMPRDHTPDSFNRLDSPLASAAPPPPSVSAPTHQPPVQRHQQPAESLMHEDVDDMIQQAEAFLVPDSEGEAEPEPAPFDAAANQSEDFDNLLGDLNPDDLADIDAADPHSSHPQHEHRHRQSTPRKTAEANISKNTIVIDSDSDQDIADDEPIISRHFQKKQQQSAVTKPIPSGSSVDPRMSAHPWSRDVFKVLSQMFKLPGFRKNQLEAINGTLSGKDVFVLMPTGGGKSLCYQLPALVQSGVTKGITIVVSPLISLIHDQVNSLVAKGITTLPFNGDMDKAQRDFVLGEMRSNAPTVALIYITPEMVCGSTGQSIDAHLYLGWQLSSSNVFAGALDALNRNKNLARFVIDEAHCQISLPSLFFINTDPHLQVSALGVTTTCVFTHRSNMLGSQATCMLQRPAYKELDKLKRNYPDVPIIALTATANSRVREDVCSNLRLHTPVVLTQSFNRTNLHYEVRKKEKGLMEQIATFIKNDHAGECGIIYCLSKKNCEDVASQLRSKHNIKAMHYHAGMDKADRKRVQTDWQAGKLLVICATIAFGMGIDKENCRFVVHHSLPKSLEGYYQETGRAGRDGNPSICILYFACE